LQELLTAESKPQISYTKKFCRKYVMIAFSIFLLSFITAIIFHFTAEPPKRTLCFDARQYIFDTARVAEFILALLKGQWRPALICDQQFLTSILADGPAFPTIFATIFAVLGHAPGIQDCRVIEVLQSLMHAFSASFLFAISYLLTARWKAAAFAGLAWGLYPAAIFWSGIFYTETTVILFSLLFMLALSQSQRLGFAILSGILAGIVALLKPALLPAALIASLLTVRISKKHLLFAICGIAISLAPWVLYTRLLTGHACITAQRFPAFNLAMGADTEVDACLVSPAPPLTTLFSRDTDMPFAFPLSQWQYHTNDCLRLAAVKLSCLLSRQANDFRLSFFGLRPEIQNYWHLFLLFAGLSGLSYTLLNWRNSPLKTHQSTLLLASLVFLGSHLSYILFTPAARYGLTAMPFFILFASLLPVYVFETKSRMQKVQLASVFLVSAVLICGLVYGKNLSLVFNSAETAHSLQAGERAAKYIDLQQIRKPVSIYSILLLVDADANIENARVIVNGKALVKKLQHIRYFDSSLYLQAFELRSLGYPSGISTDEFRHWRAVEIPSDLIRWSGPNKIELLQEKGNATIYGDPLSSRRNMQDLHYFSVNSLCNSDSSTDLRILSPVKTGNIETRSLLIRPDKEQTVESLADSLRVRLAVVTGSGTSRKERTNDGELITEQSLRPNQFDLYLQVPEIDGIRASRTSMKAAHSMGTLCQIPTLNKSSHVNVLVEGELRGARPGKAEVVIALQPDRQGGANVLNCSPQLLPYSKEWQHFSVVDQVPTSILDDKKTQSLYVAVYPGPWLDFSGYPSDRNCGTAEFRNLKFKIFAQTAVDISGKRVLFY
jgi:hypothetical protein